VSDAGLLGFGEGEEDDLDDDLSESEEEEEDGGGGKAQGIQRSQAAAKQQQQQQAKTAAAKKKATKTGAAAAAAVESDEEGDEDGEGDGGDGQQAEAAGVQVTSSMVEGWCTAALEKASLGSMMQLVKAYRSAELQLMTWRAGQYTHPEVPLTHCFVIILGNMAQRSSWQPATLD
jgi:hypothetical protein